MTIDYIPRRQVAERLRAGWRLIPGHEYNPADYAILMMLPEVQSPVTAKWMKAVAARFEKAPAKASNKSAGASSRNHARYRREVA